MKFCSSCQQTKEFMAFNKNKCRPDGLSFWCKSCRKTKEPKSEKQKKSAAKRNKIWHQKNKLKHIQQTKAWILNNRLRFNELHRNWNHKNKNKISFYAAKRRANKLNQTPKWLSLEQKDAIKKIYATCPKGYHVDHIIPLNGKNVNGLHVSWNLQHLPAIENIKKGNLLW